MALRSKRVGSAECTQSCCEGRTYDTLCHTCGRVAQHALETEAEASDALVERMANFVVELERVHLRELGLVRAARVREA